MSNKQLLTCFFETCQHQFGFLKSEYGFLSLAGLTSYERGRHIITPYDDSQSASYPFDATMRFETDDICVELCYGDYNFTLECHITYQRRYRFLLSDLIALLPGSSTAPIQYQQSTSGNGAPQQHHIESLLQTTQQILEAYRDTLLNPPEDFITRALEQQAMKQAKMVASQYRRDKERACEKAEKAFTKQDYRTTIMLYRPYKDDLEPQEHRIFSLAILQLDQ